MLVTQCKLQLFLGGAQGREGGAAALVFVALAQRQRSRGKRAGEDGTESRAP